MNSLRVPLIHNSLLGLPVKATPTSCHTPYPLEGYDILDVGCGAGFLCEPLARLGAKVTGLEPSEEVAAVAVKHSKLDPEVTSRVEYRCQTLEAMRGEDRDRQFDCVVASEVVEHVTDVPLFLGLLTSFVKPGGYVILTTINRTLMSYLTAIIGAEYLLRLLPQGTHCWNQFRTPRELTRELEWNGVQVDWVQGMWFNPVTSKWAWSDSTSVNYALRARQTK
jgi:ubiquinone biosynthesis O-methyltransferase